jgi:predicted nucleotidyltransferase
MVCVPLAEIPTSVAVSLDRFLTAVRQRHRVQAAYLYGSQVSGTATDWSDIDVAVVSPDFSADLFEERVALMRLAAQVDDRIEPHPFTPEDFSANHPLVSEIQRTGVRIA